MRLYIFYTFAILTISGCFQYAHSAQRVPFNPTTQQIFSMTPYDLPFTAPNGMPALIGKETAYNLSLEGQVNNALNANKVKVVPSEYGRLTFPNGPGAWTGGANAQVSNYKQIKVKPKVFTPRGNIFTALKKGLKVTPAQLATTVAISGVLAAVGWVMDPENNTLQRPANPDERTPAPLAQYYWKAQTTSYCGGQTFTRFQTGVDCLLAARKAQEPSLLAVKVASITGTTTRPQINFSVQVANGSWVNSGGGILEQFGTCASPYVKVDRDCLAVSTGTFPVTDDDYPTIETAINGLNVANLAEIIRATCQGSNNPSSCFAEMEDRSQRTISGPAEITGGSSTKTTNYTKPDGTPATKTETTTAKHKMTYGDTYIDIRTDYETTINDNGQITNITETDTEIPETPPEEEPEPDYQFSDADFPAVTPFYVPVYPDGLTGVWDSKSAEFQDSEFVEFMGSFAPSFSGTCPSWSMSFSIGSLGSFGTHDFANLCYVFDFVKICMLLGATFLCRAIIFGG